MFTWIGIGIAALAAASAVVFPAIQDVVKESPGISALVGALYAILMALSKSPLFQPPANK